MGKIIHNDTGSKLYNMWYNLRARCKYACTDSYTYYGQRGITTCKEWEDYTVFKTWALANNYLPTLQIDRIDNNEGYSPNNCRFVTVRQNSLNRRLHSNKQIGKYKGVRFYKPSGTWVVYVSIECNKEKNLGYYQTEYTALLVRNSYILEHGLDIPIQNLK